MTVSRTVILDKLVFRELILTSVYWSVCGGDLFSVHFLISLRMLSNKDGRLISET